MSADLRTRLDEVLPQPQQTDDLDQLIARGLRARHRRTAGVAAAALLALGGIGSVTADLAERSGIEIPVISSLFDDAPTEDAAVEPGTPTPGTYRDGAHVIVGPQDRQSVDGVRRHTIVLDTTVPGVALGAVGGATGPSGGSDLPTLDGDAATMALAVDVDGAIGRVDGADLVIELDGVEVARGNILPIMREGGITDFPRTAQELADRSTAVAFDTVGGLWLYVGPPETPFVMALDRDGAITSRSDASPFDVRSFTALRDLAGPAAVGGLTATLDVGPEGVALLGSQLLLDAEGGTQLVARIAETAETVPPTAAFSMGDDRALNSSGVIVPGTSFAGVDGIVTVATDHQTVDVTLEGLDPTTSLGAATPTTAVVAGTSAWTTRFADGARGDTVVLTVTRADGYATAVTLSMARQGTAPRPLVAPDGSVSLLVPVAGGRVELRPVLDAQWQVVGGTQIVD